MIRARRGTGMNTSIQYAPLLAPDRGCSRAATPLIISVKSGRSGRFGLDTLLHRAGVEPLGVDVAVDELDHRDRRGIAVAVAGLEHARIAAVAVLVARADHLKQLLHHGEVAHLRDRLPARMQPAALTQRDE